MSKLENLKLFQRIDLELEARRTRLKEVEAALVEPQKLLAARVAQEEGERQLGTLGRSLRELEWELRSLTDRLLGVERELYGGGIRNPRQLADKEHEAQYLTRRKGELEDQVLELMAEAEDREGHLESSEARLREMEATWREEQRHLRGEQEELMRELRELSVDREKVLATIGQAELETYEDLRVKKGGLALAGLKDGICQGCMVSLPVHTVRQVQGGRGLITCGSCGRILYLE